MASFHTKVMMPYLDQEHNFDIGGHSLENPFLVSMGLLHGQNKRAVRVEIVPKPVPPEDDGGNWDTQGILKSDGFMKLLKIANRIWKLRFGTDQIRPSQMNPYNEHALQETGEQSYLAVAFTDHNEPVAVAMVEICHTDENKSDVQDDFSGATMKYPKYAYISGLASKYERVGNATELLTQIKQFARKEKCVMLVLCVNRPDHTSPYWFGDVERREFDQASQYQRFMKVRGLIDLYRKNGFKYYPDKGVQIEAYRDLLSEMKRIEKLGHASSYEKETLLRHYGSMIHGTHGQPRYFKSFEWWDEFQLCAYIGDAENENNAMHAYKLIPYDDMYDLLRAFPQALYTQGEDIWYKWERELSRRKYVMPASSKNGGRNRKGQRKRWSKKGEEEKEEEEDEYDIWF